MMNRARLPKVLLGIALTLATATSAYAITRSDSLAEVCPGDCNGDRRTTVDELIHGVRAVMGNGPQGECSAFDVDGSGEPTVDELVLAVGSALKGCTTPAVCGGLVGLPCGDGEICELPPGTCEVADQFGVCETRPMVCILVYAPVCGCDGWTTGTTASA